MAERATPKTLKTPKTPEDPKPATVDIYTDGACSGNPGPGGWGAVLRYGRHEKQIYGGEAEQTTNNRMEIMAAIAALEALTRPAVVRLHTDSTYLRNGVTKWLFGWKRNGWMTSDKKPVKNADLWRRLDAAVARHTVEWLWVKGHAGHPENELADRLANRGMTEARAARPADRLTGSARPSEAPADAAREVVVEKNERSPPRERRTRESSSRCDRDTADRLGTAIPSTAAGRRIGRVR